MTPEERTTFSVVTHVEGGVIHMSGASSAEPCRLVDPFCYPWPHGSERRPVPHCCAVVGAHVEHVCFCGWKCSATCHEAHRGCHWMPQESFVRLARGGQA